MRISQSLTIICLLLLFSILPGVAMAYSTPESGFTDPDLSSLPDLLLQATTKSNTRLMYFIKGLGI